MRDATGSSYSSSSLGYLPAGDEGKGKTHALCVVEPNHYLSHEVTMTPELVLESVFCEMPLKGKTQCLFPASAVFLISHHEGSWQMDLLMNTHWTSSLKPILESIIRQWNSYVGFSHWERNSTLCPSSQSLGTYRGLFIQVKSFTCRRANPCNEPPHISLS